MNFTTTHQITTQSFQEALVKTEFRFLTPQNLRKLTSLFNVTPASVKLC